MVTVILVFSFVLFHAVSYYWIKTVEKQLGVSVESFVVALVPPFLICSLSTLLIVKCVFN